MCSCWRVVSVLFILVIGMVVLFGTKVGQLPVVLKGSSLRNLFVWQGSNCGLHYPLLSSGAWYMACNYLPVQGGHAAWWPCLLAKLLCL